VLVPRQRVEPASTIWLTIRLVPEPSCERFPGYSCAPWADPSQLEPPLVARGKPGHQPHGDRGASALVCWPRPANVHLPPDKRRPSDSYVCGDARVPFARALSVVRARASRRAIVTSLRVLAHAWMISRRHRHARV